MIYRLNYPRPLTKNTKYQSKKDLGIRIQRQVKHKYRQYYLEEARNMRVKRSPTRHVKTQTCTHGLPFWRFTSHPLYFVCRRLTPVSCMRQSWQHALLVQLRRSGKYKIVDNNKFQVVPGAKAQMHTQIYPFDISNSIFSYTIQYIPVITFSILIYISIYNQSFHH